MSNKTTLQISIEKTDQLLAELNQFLSCYNMAEDTDSNKLISVTKNDEFSKIKISTSSSRIGYSAEILTEQIAHNDID